MRIGINGTGLVRLGSVDGIARHAQEAAAQGFSSYWLAEHPLGGLDALTVLGAAAQRAPRIELGTAIVPTWPRHPMVLAAQALTTNQLAGGRLTLGIGLSHGVMLEQGLGIPMARPIGHLRELPIPAKLDRRSDRIRTAVGAKRRCGDPQLKVSAFAGLPGPPFFSSSVVQLPPSPGLWGLWKTQGEGWVAFSKRLWESRSDFHQTRQPP